MWRLIFLVAFAAAPLSAAPFTVEQSGRSYPTLAGAVLAIGDGNGSILIAPGRYKDCAVQTAGRIAYRAARPLTVIFDGGICEGKAVLVLRGRGASVDGLIFENLRVPDGNGAGIRIEKGPLAVTRSIFRNSEEGILGGGDDPSSDISIDRSTFSGLGRCDRGLACAHSIYASAFRTVTVRRSRFEKGRGGHYVKSRAGRIVVSDCSFDDSAGRATNYMIDLPEGATGRIERNLFVQGADKENHSAFIAVAAEAQRNSSVNLLIADNLADQVRGAAWPSVLIADWSGSAKRVERNGTGPQLQVLMRVQPENPTFVDKARARLRYYAGRLRDRLID
ncbi:right-handed parallel beta-helix repeat-containing protein [Rhizorhabdus argentea]|uniref:right-handed parallel beta-helix repeat-containing protein n=1 Tax=Rhizorhabdus argentea TaxID=1387174 RepID=UPI0030EE72A3